MRDDKRHLPVKTRLLFVDDEEAIRQTLPVILEQHGFDVKVAATVPEALDIISHQTFDVLLTDLNIGSPADGFILVTAMRRRFHLESFGESIMALVCNNAWSYEMESMRGIQCLRILSNQMTSVRLVTYRTDTLAERVY